MELFWKTVAGVLIAVILFLYLGKQEKEFGVLLSMMVCCMGAAGAVYVLEPVLDLLWELEDMARMQDGVLGILIKSTGIALVSEIAGLICQDAGSTAMGKLVQFLGSTVILYLSIPMVKTLLSLMREILGEL